jgi:hypothetical protein
MPREPRRFEAMGITVEVGGADGTAFERIRSLFAAREAVFSRFRSDSELSRLNRSDASIVESHPPSLMRLPWRWAPLGRPGGWSTRASAWRSRLPAMTGTSTICGRRAIHSDLLS